ncbi:DUF222 domain-containing protein [Frankia sp. CNm7]|uniref:DUF222 domain-containing protein n=1 Tax=Frankia nepalensis TaxID=1836974 RepID=A0A937US21_9ACTN|nr:DUF222 domain-containing protein [Frankia nepalensis]MBL7498193.1 DUF222 domain-containing protein [Frankia nepalensis]MBL7513159.1 DUF222 domain-containing protein [Frankia nepalensis]MBL7521134.1 DUF222 domain-containing protein [Frankia nepalensis]MBL7628411.1 DUF222 domain-containing protein [Frankia nepalensis]
MTEVPDDRAGAPDPEIPGHAGAGAAREAPTGPRPPAEGLQARPAGTGGERGDAGPSGLDDDAPPSPGEAAVDPARLSDLELATAVIEGRATVDATTARWVLLVGEFDRRSLWLADGAASAASWLRRECRMNAPTSTHLLTVARALRDLPATRAAFVAGTISFEHVRAIAPAVGRGSPRAGGAGLTGPDRLELARRADPIFARAAAWMTPRQVARVVSTWTDIAEA